VASKQRLFLAVTPPLPYSFPGLGAGEGRPTPCLRAQGFAQHSRRWPILHMFLCSGCILTLCPGALWEAASRGADVGSRHVWCAWPRGWGGRVAPGHCTRAVVGCACTVAWPHGGRRAAGMRMHEAAWKGVCVGGVWVLCVCGRLSVARSVGRWPSHACQRCLAPALLRVPAACAASGVPRSPLFLVDRG
jgi:hypothetical protein